MKIELKSIQHSAFASRQTNCYSASLYVDSRRIGTVGNDGNGGCDYFHGDRAGFAAADAWCRANLPMWLGLDGELLDTDLELRCGALLDGWLAAKHLRSSLRSNVMFLHPDDGRLYQVRHRGEIGRTLASVGRQHPGANVLNGHSFEAALAPYRKARPRDRAPAPAPAARLRPRLAAEYIGLEEGIGHTLSPTRRPLRDIVK